MSDAQALTTDANCNVGGVLQVGNKDYHIRQMVSYSKLSGREFLRRLYLEGGSPSPVERAIAVVEDSDMLKSVYDTDNDGVVDKAEGILVLDEVPSDLSGYADGDMFKVGSRLYIVNK